MSSLSPNSPHPIPRGPQGVTVASVATAKANPGSVPLPGVSTTRVRRTPLAKTFWVLAQLGSVAHVFGSLILIRCSKPTGTSEKVISHRSEPTAVMSMREKS